MSSLLSLTEITGIGLLYLVAGALVVYRSRRELPLAVARARERRHKGHYHKGRAGSWRPESGQLWSWLLLFGSALALRLALAPLITGHPTDYVAFNAWADYAYARGLGQFYDGTIFADYPPAYIYVLYGIGWLKALLGFGYAEAGATVLLKLPAMVADLALAALVAAAARTRLGEPQALVLAGLFLFNPAVLLNSTIWAQVDAVFLLLIVLAVLLGGRQKGMAACAVYTVAVLMKPQALMFAPLLALPLLEQRNWGLLARALLASAITGLLLALPFAWTREPGWLFMQYRAMFDMYPFASLNAFNLFALLGANGVPADAPWLGLTYGVWGWMFLGGLGILSAFYYLGDRLADVLPRLYGIGLLLSVGVFTLGAGMHERYLYPALGFALLYYAFRPNWQLLALFGGLSLTHWINTAYVLGEEVFYPDRWEPLVIVVSALQVLLFIWTFLLVQQTFGGWRACLAGCRSVLSAWARQLPTSHWMMIALTIGYACVSMYQLGSLQAPQTTWQPAATAEQATLDLGEPYALAEVRLYGGLEKGNLALDVSTDGQQWQEQLQLAHGDGEVFQWRSYPVAAEARYVRLRPLTPGSGLRELAFIEAGSGRQLPVVAVMSDLPAASGNGMSGASDAAADPSGLGVGQLADPMRLVDEAHTVPARPSFLNSMYFDEIYHARTAYEHLQGIEPYESTHPPLGKLLISSGIAVFGMHPFGWRIAGVAAACLLLLAMYAAGRRLFGRPAYGVLAAGLLALDFMHFTQNRLATIDGFLVLFLVLMFGGLYRVIEATAKGAPARALLLPLLLGGMCFGLAAAVKWSALYAGVGALLAVLWVLYKRRKEAAGDRLLVAGGAVLAFAVLPLVIYMASYIPYLLVQGAGHGWSDVLRYQLHMFRYHSGLDAEHPFSSAWYTWPGMQRPVWYYSDSGSGGVEDMRRSIVALGNPAIWWAGLAAVPAALLLGWRRRERAALLPVLALALLYVPWMLVPRLTFLYHFYPMVPFVILCLVYVLKVGLEGAEGRRKRRLQTGIGLYVAVAFLLFVLFYPVLSGMEVSDAYIVRFLRWRESWVF